MLFTFRLHHEIVQINSQIIIIGGWTNTGFGGKLACMDIECFCTERKAWICGLGELLVPLTGATGVLLTERG